MNAEKPVPENDGTSPLSKPGDTSPAWENTGKCEPTAVDSVEATTSGILPCGTRLYDDDSGEWGTVVSFASPYYLWEADSKTHCLFIGHNYPGLREMLNGPQPR